MAQKITKLTAQQERRLISVDVFRATLYGLGFRGRSIEMEINDNYPAKRTAT